MLSNLLNKFNFPIYSEDEKGRFVIDVDRVVRRTGERETQEFVALVSARCSMIDEGPKKEAPVLLCVELRRGHDKTSHPGLFLLDGSSAKFVRDVAGACRAANIRVQLTMNPRRYESDARGNNDDRCVSASSLLEDVASLIDTLKLVSLIAMTAKEMEQWTSVLSAPECEMRQLIFERGSFGDVWVGKSSPGDGMSRLVEDLSRNTSLLSLEVVAEQYGVDEFLPNFTELTKTISRHPRMERVVLVGVQWKDVSHLAFASSLREVEIYATIMDEEDDASIALARLVETCPKLEVIRLGTEVLLGEDLPSLKTASLTRLRDALVGSRNLKEMSLTMRQTERYEAMKTAIVGVCPEKIKIAVQCDYNGLPSDELCSMC